VGDGKIGSQSNGFAVGSHGGRNPAFCLELMAHVFVRDMVVWLGD
jgi:hypothetical protein